MLGKVLKYNEKAELGYILGYDDVTYFFRQRDVKNNTKLQDGDTVEFDDILYPEEMPSAVRIEKREV